MRLLIILALALTIQASWFGSDSQEYTSWDSKQLRKWLDNNGIKAQNSYSQEELKALVKENWYSTQSWTEDQYNRVQKSFQGIKDSTFDAWDESRLREWLLEQGVVNPSGPREKLLLLAKQQYKGYTDAASSFGSSTTSIIYDASKSAESLVSAATDEVDRKLDDTTDYVYSTWDESQLKNWLVSKGVLKSNEQKSRDETLKLMRDYYAKAADPVWNAWSDSYIRQWLVSRGLVTTDFQKNRDALVEQMNKYYYSASDKVWSTWSDSELKAWLVEHDIVKPNARIQREKMLKLISDNYTSAPDTFWSAWSESDIRSWLINHGYLESNSQTHRDELVALINEKITPKTVPYLTWPDARLRAYLRNKGLPETTLPTSRPGLLQEVRIRYVQSSNSAQVLFNKIRDTVNSGVEAAEETIGRVLELLSGTYDDAKHRVEFYKDDSPKNAEYYRDEALEKGADKGKEGLDYGKDKTKGRSEL